MLRLIWGALFAFYSFTGGLIKPTLAIFAQINFGIQDYTMALENKENVLIRDNFSHFSIKNILWYLLQLPHRGEFNGMQQCIYSWNGIENISNAYQVFHAV